jgi:hypothetical protein
MLHAPIKPSPTVPARGAKQRSASAVLGPEHPLTRADATLHRAIRQARPVVAVLVGSIIAAARGARWAPATAVGALVVLLGLALIIVALARQRRGRAIALVLDGRESLPIAEIQRQRRRLLAARTRIVLATTLEKLITEPAHEPRFPVRSARAPVDATMIAAVTPEIREVGRLLQDERATARPVALVERLVTDGGSPLYGHQTNELRETLHRLRHLLHSSTLPRV